MPFFGTPSPIIASLTDAGRNLLARASFGDVAFKVSGFAVGHGGYNDSNPIETTPINTASSDLLYQFFPATGSQKNIAAFEYPTPKTLVVNCRLADTEAIAGLGEIGLWVEILDSSVSAEIGTKVLFAIGHFGIMTKTARQAILYRYVIQF
jgi:hypothetical protein